jgi:hypothetical protein
LNAIHHGRFNTGATFNASTDRRYVMRRNFTLVSIISLLFVSLLGITHTGIANDEVADDGGSLRHCNPTGTWFDDAIPGYMTTIVPIQENSRFSIVFQGNYNPGDLSLVMPIDVFETMTDWSGEMIRAGNGYDAAAIAIFGPVGFPHWPPQTWGVKGRMEFVDNCNTIQATWHDCIHAWIWDPESPNTPPPIPWVDEPDYFPQGEACEALYETYYRMPMPKVFTE